MAAATPGCLVTPSGALQPDGGVKFDSVGLPAPSGEAVGVLVEVRHRDGAAAPGLGDRAPVRQALTDRRAERVTIVARVHDEDYLQFLDDIVQAGGGWVDPDLDETKWKVDVDAAKTNAITTQLIEATRETDPAVKRSSGSSVRTTTETSPRMPCGLPI